ncbi:hypothetical protein EDD35_0268 [Amycolatopsis thermoflava]|uniref:Uncharacterized protein n=1 Tax=Amycolatopsis thermoflava TaxID=84480 RepID=A0A3N2GMZ0_9PSEU|nr:hypothetical protein EDD35_0268 [Amycolatopsis thermoflava]
MAAVIALCEGPARMFVAARLGALDVELLS